ncbi:ribonuclease H-like domain-containing protein [Tanacetum coccineum]
MSEFCKKKGIKKEVSIARTPQQNGVAERRNMTLIEAARTMLAGSKLPTTFWAKAVNTACYVQNRVLVVKPHNRPLYELFKGTNLMFLQYNVNTGSLNINNVSPTITTAPLEATYADFIGDETEIDMSNITYNILSSFYSKIQNP